MQATQCLPATFTSMPDFSNMTQFNTAFKLCSNGGTFTSLSQSTKQTSTEIQKLFY